MQWNEGAFVVVMTEYNLMCGVEPFFQPRRAETKSELQWPRHSMLHWHSWPCAPKSYPRACLPLCRVCFPPESTPLGSMPVGVRPFSVRTLSLSSLEDTEGAWKLRFAFFCGKKIKTRKSRYLPHIGSVDLLFYLKHKTFLPIYTERIYYKWLQC